MKRLMTAAVAATLMCGVSAYAYAQDTQPAMSSPSQGADQSGPAPQGSNNSMPSSQGTMGTSAAPGSTSDMGAGAPQMNSAAPPAGGDMGAGTPPMAGGAPPATAPGSDMSSGPAETADTPNGQPPSTYPPCKHKGEDRCVQTGKMMESGSMKSHHMEHHMRRHMKAKMVPASDAAPASTAPAPGQ